MNFTIYSGVFEECDFQIGNGSGFWHISILIKTIGGGKRVADRLAKRSLTFCYQPLWASVCLYIVRRLPQCTAASLIRREGTTRLAGIDKSLVIVFKHHKFAQTTFTAVPIPCGRNLRVCELLFCRNYPELVIIIVGFGDA